MSGKGNKAKFTENLLGQRFSKLVVIRLSKVGPNGKQYWKCLCDCGNTKVFSQTQLIFKDNTNCGCEREYHGLSKSRTYGIWRGMIYRCEDMSPNGYGVRGITVCNRWYSFSKFVEDMGLAPNKLEIERIDNNGNYCPENCKWATRPEQMRNTRQNRNLTFNGKTQCMVDWAKETGISFRAIHGRLTRGWSVERALTIPASRNNPRPKLTRK